MRIPDPPAILRKHWREYISLGYSPLGVHPRGTTIKGKARDKSPVLYNWQRFCDEPPTRSDIAATLEFQPNAQVGCACGYNGLAPLDFDSEDEKLKKLFKIWLRENFADAPLRRGSPARFGAAIFLWEKEDEVAPWMKFVGEDGGTIFELLGHGRQIVMPPSIHPSGREYEMADGEDLLPPHIDDLPLINRQHIDDLVARIEKSGVKIRQAISVQPEERPTPEELRVYEKLIDTKAALKLVKEFLLKAPISIQGKGGHHNAVRVWHACIDKGCPPHLVVGMMHAFWDSRNDPPWGSYEALDAELAGLLNSRRKPIGADNPDRIAKQHLEEPHASADEQSHASSEQQGDTNTPDDEKEKPTLSPANSEDVLALAFAHLHTGKKKRMEGMTEIRYVHVWKQWFYWNGTYWQKDETLRVRDKAREICRRAANACNNLNEAKKLASAKTVMSVEALAKDDPRFAATVDQWDADRWLLNTPGGIVDLRTGEMRPARPEDYCTKITSVAPSDDDCPLWKGFLDAIFNGDQELIAYEQRLLGYCLTGATHDHAMFFKYGPGANGKSVLISTVTGILNTYHRAAPAETFMVGNLDRHPTDLAMLHGARLVTVSETETGRRWAESRIKQLTGGDPVSARFMRRDFFEYVPQFKLMIAGNHKPSLQSMNEAIKRRFHLIPFNVTIPPEQRDPMLAEKLKAEHGAILKWMIAGCLEWQRIGLAPPAAAQQATAEYLAEEDSMADWLDASCERVSDHWESLATLFDSWKAWAAMMNEPVGTNKTFAEALAQHGFARHKKTSGQGFLGVRLKRGPDNDGGAADLF